MGPMAWGNKAKYLKIGLLLNACSPLFLKGKKSVPSDFIQQWCTQAYGVLMALLCGDCQNKGAQFHRPELRPKSGFNEIEQIRLENLMESYSTLTTWPANRCHLGVSKPSPLINDCHREDMKNYHMYSTFNCSQLRPLGGNNKLKVCSTLLCTFSQSSVL